MKKHIAFFVALAALCSFSLCSFAQNDDTPDNLCGVTINQAHPIDYGDAVMRCAQGARPFINASGWQIDEVVSVPPAYIKKTFKNCDGDGTLPQQEWSAACGGSGDDISRTLSLSVTYSMGIAVSAGWGEASKAEGTAGFDVTGGLSYTLSTTSDKQEPIKSVSIPKCQLATVGYRTIKCRKTQYVSYGICYGQRNIDDWTNSVNFEGSSKSKLVGFDYTRCQKRIWDAHKCPGCACK